MPQFDVVFVIDVADSEAALAEVSGWHVTPGATLKFIHSSQPVSALAAPEQIPDSGEVPDLTDGGAR